MLFGSLGFTAHSHRREKPLNEANAFKNTDGGVRYIKQLKYKMQRHKDLEEEFEDLKVKKESKYQNPWHEQTRKIFLNDLEELKAKHARQMDMYRTATSRIWGIPADKIQCFLIHVRKGELVEV